MLKVFPKFEVLPFFPPLHSAFLILTIIICIKNIDREMWLLSSSHTQGLSVCLSQERLKEPRTHTQLSSKGIIHKESEHKHGINKDVCVFLCQSCRGLSEDKHGSPGLFKCVRKGMNGRQYILQRWISLFIFRSFDNKNWICEFFVACKQLEMLAMTNSAIWEEYVSVFLREFILSLKPISKSRFTSSFHMLYV